MATSDKQTQRIQRDFDALHENPLPFVQNLNLTRENDMHQITATVIGPNGSDYQGGRFLLKIIFPSAYPFKAPQFFFTTKVCHPNVDWPTGEICHDLLSPRWTASITLRALLEKLNDLLAHPSYDYPIEGDITEKNRETARECTQKYASADPES